MHPSELLSEIKNLLELNGANPFKVRAFEKASRSLAGHENLLERAQQGTLSEIPGVGKGIADVLTEYLLTGRSSVRDELVRTLPVGLLELTQISGLGPKKAIVLIEELGIHSLAELEYACRENRLIRLKGFGPKVQEKILEGILFHSANQGFQKYSDVYALAEECVQKLKELNPGRRVSQTGPLRRKLEILSQLDFLIELSEAPKKAEDHSVEMEGALKEFLFEKRGPRLPIHLHFATRSRYGFELARTTGTVEHWAALGNPQAFDANEEIHFYQKLNLPFIPPELRETGEEVELAKKGYLSQLLPWKGLKGVFHNHTVRSDGTATLDQMVAAAVQLGFEYIGISDHSQSAFYAQGLKEDTLKEQEREIREVQAKYPQIRVFWGIESDILEDGSLDYDKSILSRFDFVIASIHSRFKMDRAAMTQRILNAVRNPATRFLGHPTGRILLGRKGFDVDMEAVIAEAAQCNVAVELNVNPSRLDFDWRLGKEMRKYQTLTSINPDAHGVDGLKDVDFGIVMARKALISANQVINSKPVVEVEKWLKRM